MDVTVNYSGTIINQKGIKKIIFPNIDFSNVTESDLMFHQFILGDLTSGNFTIVVKNNTAKEWIRNRLDQDVGTNLGTVTVG